MAMSAINITSPLPSGCAVKNLVCRSSFGGSFIVIKSSIVTSSSSTTISTASVVAFPSSPTSSPIYPSTLTSTSASTTAPSAAAQPSAETAPTGSTLSTTASVPTYANTGTPVDQTTSTAATTSQTISTTSDSAVAGAASFSASGLAEIATAYTITGDTAASSSYTSSLSAAIHTSIWTEISKVTIKGTLITVKTSGTFVNAETTSDSVGTYTSYVTDTDVAASPVTSGNVSPSSSDSSTASRHCSTGKILGGVLGALAAILVFIVLLFYGRRRRHHRRAQRIRQSASPSFGSNAAVLLPSSSADSGNSVFPTAESFHRESRIGQVVSTYMSGATTPARALTVSPRLILPMSSEALSPQMREADPFADPVALARERPVSQMSDDSPTIRAPLPNPFSGPMLVPWQSEETPVCDRIASRLSEQSEKSEVETIYAV
ncbi:uncharacterized protein LAESUDRAFT_56749 [Laetiporus sulphureus 93-53]|uniref:Mid2 domain-containing protein n=1 Tax=Laetiporus sulphureus 93-53 TaxID=1314785 RepID=A0A165FDP8_9APHY|nr:uncharacterized protein LAESUDRAFT_56749 [Laetiporus sulphureus 93-53]KZT08813.1 hypothetical protein LAESUDRAFT_56749 [Laetiporus sulphureus 93-53]